MFQDDLRKGAENLLVTCASMKQGDKLLVIHEDPALGYYDQGIVDAVVQQAANLGISTTVQMVPFRRVAADPEPELMRKMETADRTLFLARLGDQIRFRPAMAEIRPIMSYALDAGMLGSAFGQADYNAFVRLKEAANACLAGASEIHVTCPLGTDFRGPFAAFPSEAADTTVTRFPMSVFTPVPVDNFAGKVVQQGFLVGTGSHFYTPYACGLSAPIEVFIESGAITEFDGSDADVRAARAHYEHVGELFDIEPYRVHSWHAGIHPGCAYDQSAASSFERWGGGAFGNTRLLHFHTCGTYAPGEISLNVLDPTIRVDGVAIWADGRFYPDRLSEGPAILEQFPELRELFENPAQSAGQCPNGTLSYSWK